MGIYIISNRSVDSTGKKFLNNGKEKARPSFRIAKVNNPESKRLSYKILLDNYPEGYKKVVEKLESKEPDKIILAGSESMFYDLYTDTICYKHDLQKEGGKKKIVKNDILFFIHGFSTGFKSSLNHAKKLYELYVKNDQSPIRHIVYLSWPSRNSKLFTYGGDQDDARDTGAILARIFRKTQNFYQELFDLANKEYCLGRIHMMAHSMGCQVLETFMQTIAKEKYLPIISEVLLLHADVQDNIFEKGESFSYLKNISRRVHIYIHNGDDALRISRFTKNGTKRLGQRGPRDISILNDETFIVDVSDNDESVSLYEEIIDHWGYLERDLEIEDIINVLNGKRENFISTRKKDIHGRKNYFLIN